MVEVAYWRKCWGIRDAIVNKLHLPIESEDYKLNAKFENGDYKLNVEDIAAIIKILKPFFSEDYWNEYADSIWEFNEYFDNMLQIMINLKWLQMYMKINPDIEVVFYDSY